MHAARTATDLGRLWRLVVDIYEPESGDDFPVLRHVFYGKTQADAQGTFRAHMTTDEFLRDCVEKGRWDDLNCRATYRWVAPGETIDDY